MLLQNFDIYFPVQLWESRDGTRYRLEPPLLGYKDEYRWNPYFWPSTVSDDTHRELEAYWKLRATVWGFNSKYSPSLNRGFVVLAVQNTMKQFPYATEKISVFRNSYAFYSSDDVYHNSFGVATYAYPLPGTRLLYIQNDSRDQRPLKIVLCNDSNNNDKEECPDVPELAFLPRHANKRISCYDIVWDNFNLFLYVFPELPRGQFFRLTPTGLCVPSEKETDHKSMLECIQHSAAMRVLPNNISTGSPLAELQQVMYSYPSSTKTRGLTKSGVISVMVFALLLSLLFSFLLLSLAWKEQTPIPARSGHPS